MRKGMKSSEVRLIQEARDRAMDVLMKCVTPYGFRASAEKAGYPRCGGGDSVVTLSGAAATGKRS